MAKSPFTEVKEWRASDRHTGIGKDRGVPYTYQHLGGRRPPAPKADVYRIETFVPYVAPVAIHGHVHYVPASKLDAFFYGWGDYAETVIDIRPMTTAEALEELRAFQTAAEKGGSR